MRKLLLSAVAAFAVTAPGSASAGDGYFGLSYSSADQGSGVDSINFGGAANFDLTSSLEAQVDGNFTRVETSSGFNHTYSTANLHVFHRTDGYLFGGYFGYDEPAFGADSFSLGVEGQLYLSRLSLDGAVAYTTAEGGAAFDESGATMRAGATWFPTDNLSIGEVPLAELFCSCWNSANFRRRTFASLRPLAVQGKRLHSMANPSVWNF